MDEPLPDLELLGRRAPLTWPLLASLGFVALGLVGPQRSAAVSVAALVLFGAFALVLAVSLLPGAYALRLSPRGFRIRTLFLWTSFDWASVEEFRAVESKGGPGVAYWLLPSVPRARVRRGLERALTDDERPCDGFVLPVRDLTVPELATLLERYRRTARRAGTA